MRAIIDIFLAIIFSVVLGTSGMKALSVNIKKEAMLKVSGGIGSLEAFTQKFTK